MTSGYDTEAVEAAPQAPARARVVSTNPARARVLFEGLVKDARVFIQNNFPRPHVEPPGSPQDVPVPDVVLVNQDGTKEQYHADNGWSPAKEGN